MIHAQCRELSLSTGTFSHSHAYDRSVAARGPYTIILLLLLLLYYYYIITIIILLYL